MNLLEPTKIHSFLHSGVKTLNTCVLDFCVCSLISLSSRFFSTVFNLWIGPGFIFELVVTFQLLNSHFPVTTLGLPVDLFSSSYLNKLLFLWCQVTESNSV
jgi:hypothetical protein